MYIKETRECMKISIITPCFNSAGTIAQTIESVLGQTYQNYEYIIVDGRSIDGTLEIIDGYKSAFKKKLTVISEADSGIYDAMNKGIQRASGDIIGIINSDDWYEPEALQNVVDTYMGQKYSVFYGMMRFFEGEKEFACAIYHPDFMDRIMINHPTCFVTKDIYRDFGVYDLRYKAAADYDYMLMLYKSNKVSFIPIYKIQANFRSGGITGSVVSMKETMEIRRKYGFINRWQYIVALIACYVRKMISI